MSHSHVAHGTHGTTHLAEHTTKSKYGELHFSSYQIKVQGKAALPKVRLDLDSRTAQDQHMVTDSSTAVPSKQH